MSIQPGGTSANSIQPNVAALSPFFESIQPAITLFAQQGGSPTPGDMSLPDGVSWPETPGALVTREELTRGDIQIPFSSIQGPLGPTFRGAWRTYGQIVFYEDFTSEVAPDLVVTSQTGLISVSEPTRVDLADTPTGGRPVAPGAKAISATASNSAGASYTDMGRLGIDLSTLNLPVGLEVTRATFMLYFPFSNNPWRTRWFCDSAFGPDIAWAASWRIVSIESGLTNNSVVGIESHRSGTSTNQNVDIGARIGFTAFTVYGVYESDYSMGDTVSYDGHLWQSLVANNNDEPGTTNRWIDLGVMG